MGYGKPKGGAAYGEQMYRFLRALEKAQSWHQEYVHRASMIADRMMWYRMRHDARTNPEGWPADVQRILAGMEITYKLGLTDKEIERRKRTGESYLELGHGGTITLYTRRLGRFNPALAQEQLDYDNKKRDEQEAAWKREIEQKQTNRDEMPGVLEAAPSLAASLAARLSKRRQPDVDEEDEGAAR